MDWEPRNIEEWRDRRNMAQGHLGYLFAIQDGRPRITREIWKLLSECRRLAARCNTEVLMSVAPEDRAFMRRIIHRMNDLRKKGHE